MAHLPKGQSVVPMPPFLGWLASNVPAVYDNTMSYYEELTSLIKYLQDTVVPALNADSEAITVLSNFVEHYFDNLDVQEEINNKLDQMAEDGTLQEIITDYIQANVAWTFDTVADMKQATNLVNGSYARTLGFHSLNDGGGALYYISNTGTADEMSVIAIGSLYAVLVADKANVKQFGAYGDDTTADDGAITGAYNYAIANTKILYFPKATYKVTTSLSLKHCTIECEGTIDNSSSIILGANSTASTITNVSIYKINDIQIEGAKDSEFNISHAGNITLLVNGNISTNTSIAYCKFNGIDCSSITLTGSNNGWINENEFNIKRCMGDLIITGDGTYSHNNNHFKNICIEGGSNHITINYGHHNYITYRGEGNPVVTVSSDPSKCFANVINRLYQSSYGNQLFTQDINKSATFNNVGADYFPTTNVQELFHITTENVKTINSTLYVNNNGVVGAVGWSNEYMQTNLKADKPFILLVDSDTASQRVFITCYDSSNNVVSGTGVNLNGSGFAPNNEGVYQYSSNQSRAIISFAPSTAVDHMTLRISTGSNATYSYALAKVFTPYLNIYDFSNEIKYTAKYSANIPSSLTAGNPTWVVGDVVYATTPTAGGNIGWVCTTAGTGASSVWKTFGAIAS